MARLIYLVAPSIETGAVTARQRGWAQIGRGRFVTPAKDDVRVVCRFAEFVPLSGVTPMMKSAGYDDALEPDDFAQFDFSEEAKWSREKVRFDEFVAAGRGEWLELS